VQFLLSTCFENDDRVLLSKQLQRGYYVYKDIWGPPVSEIVFCECGNRNPRDPYTVALRKDSITVGHILCAILCIWLFLNHGDTLQVCHSEADSTHENSEKLGSMKTVKTQNVWSAKI